MQVFKIKFGLNEDKGDSFGIRFFGDIDSRVNHFGSINEMFPGPDQVPITNQNGCNATKGFAVTAETTDDSSLHLIEEIETIKGLAIKFGEIVYGRVLKKLTINPRDEVNI
jgi:hypothetical protein